MNKRGKKKNNLNLVTLWKKNHVKFPQFSPLDKFDGSNFATNFRIILI